MKTQVEQAHHLIKELNTLIDGEQTVKKLVDLGSAAVEPLRSFLLEQKPRKIFQPRLWAVKALALLGARDVLIEYLLQQRSIADPEDRFGEEAVESAAVRFLSNWPSEEVYQLLFELSRKRMLVGLMDALAEYRHPKTIDYFLRALEDDFYRPAAEDALSKLGEICCDALSLSAITPSPCSSMENFSSLERRRSSLRILNRIGISFRHWEILKKLIDESDKELVISCAKLGVPFATKEEGLRIAEVLLGFIGSVPWYLQEDMEDVLTALSMEARGEIEEEIAYRMEQPEDTRRMDQRLGILHKLLDRFQRKTPDKDLGALEPGR